MTGDIEDTIAKLIVRVEDVELKQLELEEPIKELTPSDDLEDVKRTVNHIVKALNKATV